MLLQTNLDHLATEAEFKKVIEENENVMICCGRMGPMCMPVYEVMEQLQSEDEYSHVAFKDMAFDAPFAHVIRDLPECQTFMGLPFTVYFKNGKVAKATTSLQYHEQITNIIGEHLKK